MLKFIEHKKKNKRKQVLRLCKELSSLQIFATVSEQTRIDIKEFIPNILCGKT